MASSTDLVPSSSQNPNSYPYPLDEGEESTPTLSLRDLLGILKRRRQIAITVFALVFALGVAVTLMTKPTFRTGARLMVQGTSRAFTISNNNDPLQGVFQAKPGRDVDTQIEILRSSETLGRVFKKAGVAPGTVSVDVRRVQLTDFIEITVTSSSADAAQRFATAMPEVYRDDTRDDVLKEVRAALVFAESSLKEQNDKLRRSENNLGKYNRQKEVTGDSSEVGDAIATANESRTELVKTESSVASLTAQLNALERQRRGLPTRIESPVTITNPQLQILRDQVAGFRSERDRLSFLYKPGDDEIRKIDASIRDYQSRIAATPPTITNRSISPNPALQGLEEKIGDTRAALDAARDSLGPLRAQLDKQSRRLAGFSTIQLQQAQLQRDRDISASASKSLSQTVLQLTLKKQALEAQPAPVTIMQAAGPAAQIAPRLSRNLIMALFLACLLAMGAALLQESLDDHIRDEDEARRLLRTPILGYFPQLALDRQRPLLDLENPDRVLLENFRVLRSNVQFTLVNSPGRKLQVTSSVPGEGKSYVASNLAIAMALDGRRVVLVDADLHRPTMHTVFDVPRQPGLTNVLVGSVKLLECLQEVGIPNLRVLSAGASPPNPVELLNSPAMDAVMEMLEREADVVIFDTPPLLATADSQVMSSKVDGVIYVMQLGRVPRSAVQRSFELLQQAQARVAGMVFNKVDEPQRGTSYGNYGAYYYASNDDDDSEDGKPTAIRAGDPGGEGMGSLMNRAKGFLPQPRTNGASNSNGAASTNGAKTTNGSTHAEAETVEAESLHAVAVTEGEAENRSNGA